MNNNEKRNLLFVPASIIVTPTGTLVDEVYAELNLPDPESVELDEAVSKMIEEGGSNENT
jgi:hypothetical protein